MQVDTAAEFYAKCNLKGNPFRTNPTQESDSRADIWAGYDVEKSALTKYLIRTRSDQIGNINFLLLYGDLGTGKSHALLWARHQILEKHKDEYDAVAYYIQTLRQAGKISFGSAYKSEIINKTNILRDLLSYKQFLAMAVVKFIDHNKLDAETKQDEVLGMMIQSAEHLNFVNSLMQCSTVEDVHGLLVPPGFNDHVAVQTLATVFNLLVSEISPSEGEFLQFRKATYLFIDEIDLLGTSSSKEARDANEIFRHLYDLCPNAFCFILGFTATAAELPTLFAEYVLSRVNKQIILEHMEVNEAKEFIKNILDSARVDNKGKAGYYPFDAGAIDGIVSRIVSITPRKLVKGMQQILESSRLYGASPTENLIDLNFLDEHEILDEDLE